jgi:hypothetical protein
MIWNVRVIGEHTLKNIVPWTLDIRFYPDFASFIKFELRETKKYLAIKIAFNIY